MLPVQFRSVVRLLDCAIDHPANGKLDTSGSSCALNLWRPRGMLIIE